MADILHQLIIQVKPETVYSAITSPPDINNWWTLRCSGNPKPGALYELYFSEEYDWTARVKNCVPNQSISWEMERTMNDWQPTIFGFELTSHNENQCKVRFFHKNWDKVTDHYEISSYCWAILLNGLKNYLEKGIIVPFEERA